MTELNYTPVPNRIRVCHYPQVPCDPFRVGVNSEWEAYLIVETLAKQHLWLYENKMIPDYCNAIIVEMWDTEDGWVDYYNETEVMDWEEFVQTYFEK